MMIQFNLIFLMFTMGCATLALAAEHGRKPTQRTYLVRPDQPHQPTEIKRTTTVEEVKALKDPTLLEKKVVKPKVVVKVVKQPQIVPSKMKFKKVVVRGRKSQPRLVFERENLDVPMVGEPMPVNFLDKVYADDSLDRLEQGGY